MHFFAEDPLIIDKKIGRHLEVAIQVIYIDIRAVHLRYLLDHLLQLAHRPRIIQFPLIPIDHLPRQFILYLAHHDLHGPAETVPVVPVIPVDEEDDSSHPDDKKGEKADEDEADNEEANEDIPGTFTADLEPPEFAFAASLGPEPNSYRQALMSPDAVQWTKAAEEEIEAHSQNGTWELADLPAGRRAIGSRWVFVDSQAKPILQHSVVNPL